MPLAEECTEEPANLPEHIRPLTDDYDNSFDSVVTLTCEYGYSQSEVLEMTCMKKERGVLEWEVCGTCKCMNNWMKFSLIKII